MMELQMMLGRMEGQRGRPHCTRLDNIKNISLNVGIMNLRLDARDRTGWRIATVSNRLHKVTSYIYIYIYIYISDVNE